MDSSAEKPGILNRRTLALLALLVLGALVLRLVGINWGLPGDIPQHYRSSYVPDERSAMEMLEKLRPWKGEFHVNAVAIGDAYIYPLGGVLAASKMLGLAKVVPDITWYYSNPKEFARLLLMGRIFSALCGALTVLVLFFALRKAGSRFSPLAGAAFAAFAAVHVYQSHFMKTHALAVLLLSIAYWAFTCYWQSGKLRGLFVAAALAAVAGNVTLMYGVFGAAFLAGAVVKEWPALTGPRKNMKRALYSLGGLVAVFWAVFLIINPEPVFEFSTFFAKIGREVDLKAQEVSAASVPMSIITTYLWWFASPALLVFIIAFFARRGTTPFEWWLTGTFATFLILAYVSGFTIPRFHLPIMPVLAFMVALGAGAFNRGAKTEGGQAKVGAVASVLLYVIIAHGVLSVSYFLREDPRTTASKDILTLEGMEKIATNETRPYLLPPAVRIKRLSYKEKDGVPAEIVKTFRYTVRGTPEDVVSGKVDASGFFIFGNDPLDGMFSQSRFRDLNDLAARNDRKFKLVGRWPAQFILSRLFIHGDGFVDIALYRVESGKREIKSR